MSLDCRSLVLEDNAFPSGAKIDYINISGELGSVAANAFYGVSTTIVYPANGTKWGEHKGEGFGGSLVWESYDNHVHDYKTTVVAPTCSATTCARVQVPSGSKVVSEVPVVIPFSAAQSIASVK